MGTNVNSLTRFITEPVSASLTRPSNATQYTIGDVIAAVTTDNHLLFEKVVTGPRYTGLISGATLVSSANQSTKLAANLFLFPADVTEVGDNEPWTPTDDELNECVGVIQFPAADWIAGDVTSGAGGNAICQVTNLGLAFRSIKSDSYDGSRGDLYGVLVAANAYTPVSGEVFTCNLVVAQD